MKTQAIAGTPLQVSTIALGCMRLSTDRSEAIRSIKTALDEGINFFDHADVYGQGQREETFSAIWSEAPGLRDKIILQSKCGLRSAGDTSADAPWRYDFSYEHIIEAVDASLKRLKTDHLDILLLHRPDPLADPLEVARAFDELKAAGKVRYFGVSNHTAWHIELLKTALNVPIVANQLEVSVLHNTLFNAGVITNQDNPTDPVRGEGTLEYCYAHKITVQAWGPLAAGALGGRERNLDKERVAATAETADSIARALGVARETVLIAWLLKHPARIQPIIGTMNPQRIKACCKAVDVNLSREDWYRLFIAGRGSKMP